MSQIRVISPAGEVDVGTMRNLGASLSEVAGDRSCAPLVDLSRVTFLDSTALGAVIRCHEQLRRQGRTLGIVAPEGSAAAQLIELSGVSRRLHVFGLREEAERFLAA